MATRPATSHHVDSASAKMTIPTIEIVPISSSVRVAPTRSKRIPVGSCTAAAAKNIAPMTVPMSVGDSPRSAPR